MWYSISEAAAIKNVKTRQIYRLIERKKLDTQFTNEGTMVWVETHCPANGGTSENNPNSKIQNLEFTSVPQSKITDEVINKVDGMLVSISATTNITTTEQSVAEQYGVSVFMQRMYKQELRRMFKMQSRALLTPVSGLSNIRQVLESIIVPAERSDKNTLRSGKDLMVIVPKTGEMITVEEYLKALYPNEGVNATSCYRALKARCLKKEVVALDGQPVAMDELPSYGTIRRFLGNWKRDNIAVRRGRSRKHDWEVQQQQFVTRDVTQYRPGELWIGDHTELDFMVLNENNKLDRRWISAFTDIRTGLLVGFHLSWQPNSNTIALAFRNGVLGSQLKAFTSDDEGGRYVPIQIQNVPETVMMDNGKDYRSKYTQRVFGKIDFTDDARKSIQRITKLHYTTKYHGQSKAQMERWFGVLPTIIKYLPGYKGNKYQNKPDSLKLEIKNNEILTVDEFDAYVTFAINAYNNRVRRSLKNQTPLQCYLTNQTQQRTIDIRVLDFLMTKVSNRIIRRCQVTLLGNEYYSDALMPFNGKSADIYYDPHDVGFIAIYVKGEYAAVACNKDMIGQDERGWVKLLQSRKHGESVMQDQLKLVRRGITGSEAKRILLEAELLNTTAVPAELLQKNAPTITLLTGLEQDAINHQERLDDAKELVEIEREAKKAKRKMVVNYDSIHDSF